MQEVETAGAHSQNLNLTAEQFGLCRHDIANALASGRGFLQMLTKPRFCPNKKLSTDITPILNLTTCVSDFVKNTRRIKLNQPTSVKNRLKRTVKQCLFPRQQMDKSERITWFRKMNEAKDNNGYLEIIWELTADQLRTANQLLSSLIDPDVEQQMTDAPMIKELIDGAQNSLNTSIEMASLFAVLSQPELLQKRLEGLHERVNEEGYGKIQKAFSNLNISVSDHPSANI